MKGEEITYFGVKPPKEQKGQSLQWFWYGIVVVLILGGVFFFLSRPKEKRDENLPSSQALTEYFSNSIQAQIISQIGQPIEGFTPDMFLLVYPGMVLDDFNGVKAMGGIYQITEGGLVFLENGSLPRTSADGAISDVGMQTLLETLSKRTGFPIGSEALIESLVQFLENEGGALAPPPSFVKREVIS